MERLFKLSLVMFIFIGCAKSPGFKASDYEYTRVPADPQAVATETKPGGIIRTSNKITFSPTLSETKDPKNIIVKADVKFGEKSFGEVEFKGAQKDSKIILTPVNPDLKDSLKAFVVCTSEGAGCEDFFIDVFYKENEVIYHDQVQSPKIKKDQPQKPVAPPTVAPVVQPEAHPTQESGVKPAKPAVIKKDEPVKPVPKPVKAPKAVQPNLELIPDGIQANEVQRSVYVGIADEEVRQAFHVQEPAKKEVKEEQPVQGIEVQQQPPPQANEINSFEKFHVTNQAIGSASSGRLQNGTDFLKLSSLPGMYFFVAKPKDKDHFATFDMAIVIQKIGEALQTFMPGRKLAITAMSKWGGGRLPPHQGHQNGTDADIRYLTDDPNQMGSIVSRGHVIPKFLAGNQWKLLKKTFQTNMVDAVFVDPAIKRSMCEEARRAQDFKNGETGSPGAEILKRIQTWPKHDTHFHVRIRCSSDNPRCLRVEMNFQDTGC